MAKAIEQVDVSKLLCPEGFVLTHLKKHTAYLRQDVSPQQLEMLLADDAEILKKTAKSQVRAIGHWIIKTRNTSLTRSLTSPARNRHRHRCAWQAGNHLRVHGVRVPEPLAYVEHCIAGTVTQSWHIFQYLLQYKDVETYLSEFIARGADGTSLAAFMKHLAAGINTIGDSGAWHSDLSGKNIYTRDGVRFYFIDLDAVEINTVYDEVKRLKNHVQLYDSFCDALSDTLLVPFIEDMLPESIDLRIWMPKVRATQEKRRAKVEAHWAKHGQPDHINPLRAFRTST